MANTKQEAPNIYALLSYNSEPIAVINLSDTNSAHDGLLTAIEDHFTGTSFDMDFETPMPSDVINKSHIVMIHGSGEVRKWAPYPFILNRIHIY